MDMIVIMRKMNIHGIDLNLLPPLAALLQHRHITKAAQEAGMSQPAMSRALARLRALLQDPVLQRGPHGLLLTPRAIQLLPQLLATLQGAQGLFRVESFDPRHVQRRVRIAAADVQSVLILPRLARLLAREAPGLDVQFVPFTRDIKTRMEQGEVDFAFALASTPLPPGAKSMALAGENLVLVMREGHPAARRRWQLADYSRHGHVAISVLGDGASDIDSQLAAAGLQRRIAVTAPSFTAALAVVAETDCVTTISEHFARRFAPLFGLTLKKTPLPQARLDLTLVWSQLQDQDATLTWLRGRLAAATAEAFGKRR